MASSVVWTSSDLLRVTSTADSAIDANYVQQVSGKFGFMELGDDEEDSSGEEEVDGASSVSVRIVYRRLRQLHVIAIDCLGTAA